MQASRLVCGVIALVAFACTDSQGAGAGAGAGCPAGTKAQYDSATGKLTACLPEGDGASVAQGDGGASGDGSAPDIPGFEVKSDGTGGGGDSGGGSDGGGADEGALPDLNRTLNCKKDGTVIEKWFECVPTPGSGAGLHGTPCKADADCLYGLCMFGLPIAAYDKGIGVCTKNCGYVGGGSKYIACDAEDGNPTGAQYKCAIEKTQTVGNPKQDKSLPNVYKMCVRTCLSNTDCAKINPDLPDCVKTSTTELSTPPVGVCVKLPLK